MLAGMHFLYGQISVSELAALAERLNGWLVFAGVLVLPLVGFPVSVLHLLAGMRWGIPEGMALVTASIFLQLLASHGVVQMARPLFARRLGNVRRRIPHGAHGPVSLFTMLLPGVPYFAKNYVLPLIGVPLRTYMAWCFPLHSLRATVPVIFGDQADELTPLRVVLYGVYGAAILLACAWVFRRLRGQIGDRPPEVNDPTRSA
jgi:uncharacterized membrane protein YdjX (TVP38/TMEM64 family)